MKVLSEGNVFRKFEGVKCSKSEVIIDLQFDDWTYIRCTPNHKIKTPTAYIEAKDLKVGSLVISLEGTKTIICKESITNTELVYDLVEVEDTHNFYGNNTLTHQCLYLDEIGFVQNNLAEEFFTSVYPTITASTESKIIMTSTPNGFNHFYKFWDEAEKGINGFIPYRVVWTDMPGRDQKWYDEQVQALGELKAAQEIDVCLGPESVVTIRNVETKKIDKINLKTLHHLINNVKEDFSDEQTVYIPNGGAQRKFKSLDDAPDGWVRGMLARKPK